MTLSLYKKKRNFKKTLEPKGNIKIKKQSKLLYIIQKHAASHLHYDFRLELKGVLLSWAVPKGPCLDPAIKRLAVHVEDHPLDYGSFEGTIPKGQYGGGTVMLWDKGTWTSHDADPYKAYKNGSMKFSLQGKKLQGLWKLIRINKNDKTWLLIKADDEYSKKLKQFDITVSEQDSVKTKRTMDEISQNKKAHKNEKKNPSKTLTLKKNIPSSTIPSEFSPQLATLVDKPPTGKNWIHEIKFDGYRMIAIKKNGKTRLMSRNNNDWTNKFKAIANAINELPIKNAIFDGEIVVLDENNKSNFQALQNAIKDNEHITFYYYIFDLTYYDQYNLSSLPLLERKTILKKLLNSASDLLLYSDHVTGSGDKVFKSACDLGLEGIISKEATSHYVNSRTKTWLKSKCIKRQEFVIGGYTKPQGARRYFGSLLLGTYNKKGEFIYNGNVGTGFTESSLKSLHALLKKYSSDKNPFTTKPPKLNKISWVTPKLIAEVEFTEWTQDGNLRHPSFQGLRTDKKAKNIIKEEPHKMKLKKITPQKTFLLSHPDKILYPEDKVSKQDIADYYTEIQKWILPYIINRPLTLVRCPDGYKKCFYQKHITDSASPHLHGITIKDKEGKSQYLYIKDFEGLMALIQLGVLEIHPWGSEIKNIEKPNVIIFDLDPSPEVAWKKVVTAAKEIQQQLLKSKLKCFLKTTGGKGLHIVIPIKPEYSWDDIKIFSKTFVNFLVLKNPTLYISNMSKTKRKGKIFIDYLRNQRGATSVAPYSTRARIHAPVSTPIHWSELTDNFKDTYFTIKNLPIRLKNLKKDPWKDFNKIKQSLNLKKFFS